MHGARRGVVAALTVAVVVAVVTPLVGVAGATTGAPVRDVTSASGAQVTDGDSIRQTQTYALTPSRPGEVRVTLTYEIPDRVVSLETQVPASVTVANADGFDRVNETAFEWDGTTAVATITYRTNPNETLETTGPEADSGTYISVDAGEWALFQRSRTPTRWRYTGSEPVRFEREVTTDGPGAAGDDLVYLGEQETVSRTAHGQTVRLVVPAASSLAENRSGILDSIANASDALRVGDRDTSVFVVAAPTGEVEWAVRGLQTGDADMWVQDRERLDTAENVWIHEYVHSRQRFRTTAESRWFTEASAVYYAALLTLEQDRVDFEAFEARMSEGERAVYDSVVLTDPSTWERNPDYHRGALVAGRVDERVRVASDSERTLQDTFRLLNGRDQAVTQAAFLAAVERAGNESVRTAAADLTGQRTDVTMWDQARHAAVFEQLPARIGYGLPSTDEAATYNVTGPYRETNLDGAGPIRLATGETLTLDAVVSNAGGTEGQYNATLEINGTEVSTQRGRIEPGEAVLVPLSHRFVTPGRYQMSVDGDNVTVLVERPARARVTDVEVSTRAADQGDIVVVTASVVNDAEIPGEVLVVFTRDFQSVAERQVYLPPENATEVSTGVTVPEPGEVLLSAGEARAVRVTVTPAETPTPTPTSTTTTTVSETTGGSAPGFTAALAVVALVLAALLARRR
ncbi:PGF-CTERM sorting domain-containing protein [Halomicroarcula sp. GCM10025817]|uniref:PGF-CTERM sorting domain-containing protein n=1 Tax=Haloarcula TaxID=2237 RepID=UPI0023E75BD8|nr:PGF-CTERM sorting domain-containing protein [Halomicroarcula sp. SYNS111]